MTHYKMLIIFIQINWNQYNYNLTVCIFDKYLLNDWATIHV